MQGLNKIAGVQDPVPANFPEPPPIPESEPDIESQREHSLTSRPSRSSLPVNRQPSRRTLRGQSSQPSLRQQALQDQGYSASRQSRESVEADTDGDVEWGPHHPCFPHPNPHVPLDSPEYSATRIIRIQRDWLVAGDLYPALQNLYPEILIGYIDEEEFRYIIETLNSMLKESFNPWAASSWIDSALGVATGFLWDNTGVTVTKRKVRHLERWVDDWNRQAQDLGREARIIGPRRTAFLSLDIQIPDPLIDDPILLEAELQSPLSSSIS